jgi:hypothetical protein
MSKIEEILNREYKELPGHHKDFIKIKMPNKEAGGQS